MLAEHRPHTVNPPQPRSEQGLQRGPQRPPPRIRRAPAAQPGCWPRHIDPPLAPCFLEGLPPGPAVAAPTPIPTTAHRRRSTAASCASWTNGRTWRALTPPPCALRLAHLAGERAAGMMHLAGRRFCRRVGASQPPRCWLRPAPRPPAPQAAVGPEGRLHVTWVVAPGDCGERVHPDSLRDQMAASRRRRVGRWARRCAWTIPSSCGWTPWAVTDRGHLIGELQ